MAKNPEKLTESLRTKVWQRDEAKCQGCGKTLFKIIIIDPCEEILEELHAQHEIPIYKWESECWKCGKKTPHVSYDFHAGFDYAIGSIEKIDKMVMETYSFVKKVYSKTMEQEVIANTCIHCGVLQGNWFVHEEIMLDIYYQGMDNFRDTSFPNILTLDDLINKEDAIFQKYEDIETSGHVHHIDGDPTNNRLENLILLCPSCHKKADMKRRREMKKAS